MRFINALATTLSVFTVTSLGAPAALHDVNNVLKHTVDSRSIISPTIPFKNTFGGSGGAMQGLAARSNIQGTENTASTTLSKRSVHVDAILDVIIEANTKVIAKALAKLKLDLCSDIHAKVKVVTTGLLSTNLEVIVPKISAKVDLETNAAINAKVELDTQSLVKDRIRQHALSSIYKHCPHADDRCLRKHARDIVECVERAIQQDVLHLFMALKVKLMAHVREKIAVVVRDLGVNLLVEQIHVQAIVDAKAELDSHFDMCSHVIVKGFHEEVKPHAVSSIKSICRSR
ncbi:hypothetical protein BGZ96_010741 [Linnemannia gamsii]|uniref:Uncharacterized protein n=1 Tax=Linnemannia gamsii TaxID=64522 RepID=A0ABQ7JTX4_9FUNG|nr:hypothetical protein BGZ96_010741 [Linnemannia gamsii]